MILCAFNSFSRLVISELSSLFNFPLSLHAPNSTMITTSVDARWDLSFLNLYIDDDQDKA